MAFARRPNDLRKVYLNSERLPDLRDVLAFCVQRRLGYRVVDDEELQRLTASSHHEGVCFELCKPAVPPLGQLLDRLDQRPTVLLWLDGVGNPHNLGAVLRSAAHFAVAAILVPAHSGLGLSGAVCRVAEGGAESVPLLQLNEPGATWQALRRRGFTFAATVPRAGDSVFTAALPSRLVLVFGAEQVGIAPSLVERCTMRLGIPGSGDVESLNISAAAAVFMAEWRRQHPLRQLHRGLA